MNEALTGFAAIAAFGFLLAFGLLMLFMALVQPIWCVVDCAIDGRRGTARKVVWILLLILLWSVANWFYGAFAAGNASLRWLTRLAWTLAIVLLIAFVGGRASAPVAWWRASNGSARSTAKVPHE